MEFKLTTDLSVIPESIIFNYDEIHSNLNVSLEKYRNMVVTEDGIREAKADRANLNKLITAFENERKKIKKRCLEPYNEFEKKIKSITGTIGEAMMVIDKQTKAFEEKDKNDKYQKLVLFYQNNGKTLLDIVSFEMIFDKKWLNKTQSLMDCTQEIMSKINRINADLKSIDILKSEYALQMKDVYLKTFDLSAALSENERLSEVAKVLNVTTDIPITAPITVPTTTPVIEQSEPVIKASEPVKEFMFVMRGTNSQFKELGAFIRGIGIEYEIIKREAAQYAAG